MEKRAKVLIIDDDPDFVESIIAVLESQYEVVMASDGTEGVRVAREERPDVIILDVMMGMMDEGFEVSRKLKRDPESKHIPILMLTAMQGRTGFDFMPVAGDEVWLPVEDYVDKPAPPAELLGRIEKLLEGRAQ
ncbi:MAG: response regulator [Candidatus Latescibacterota bacterium]